MNFSDTTNKDGIIQQLEFRTNLGDTGISGDTTLLAQFTGQVNTAYMSATRIIMEADGRWKWDDANHAKHAIATTDISSTYDNYPIMIASPDVKQDWLAIDRVEIKDNNGNWMFLPMRDLQNEPSSIGERYKTDGTPEVYDFDGSSIFLRPQPNYDSTKGLKIWFKRAPLEFTTSDTTKRPGFAITFHEYLVLLPTYWWEKYKHIGNPEQTKRDIKEMEIAMQKHYGQRDRTAPLRISRVYQSYE